LLISWGLSKPHFCVIVKFTLASKSNLCVRCRKERVAVKTWEEKINGSSVFFTLASCPDLSCQKIVDQENEKLEQRKVSFMFAKAQKTV